MISLRQYAEFITKGEHKKLETAMQEVQYDLSRPEELLALQKALVSLNPASVLESNIAILEAYLARNPDRTVAYAAFRNAARAIAKHPELPKEAELSIICLD